MRADSPFQNNYQPMTRTDNSIPKIRMGYNEPVRASHGNPNSNLLNTNMDSRYTQKGSADLKKIFTYNILSNQPVSKMVAPNARLPYRYALPYDFDRLNASDNQGAYAPIHARNSSNTNAGYMQEQEYMNEGQNHDRQSQNSSPLKGVYRGIRDSFKGY